MERLRRRITPMHSGEARSRRAMAIGLRRDTSPPPMVQPQGIEHRLDSTARPTAARTAQWFTEQITQFTQATMEMFIGTIPAADGASTTMAVGIRWTRQRRNSRRNRTFKRTIQMHNRTRRTSRRIIRMRNRMFRQLARTPEVRIWEHPDPVCKLIPQRCKASIGRQRRVSGASSRQVDSRISIAAGEAGSGGDSFCCLDE